ncbi:MAG: methyltransferase domain-containing protein [Candidatus Shapirobacteria bacterium]|jgi:ubiquinone/menaquinone biosynthesis C-methylase UbiE
MKNYLIQIDKLLSREPDPAYKRRAGLVLKNIGLVGREKILEVGCGRGFYVNNLAKLQPKTKIWGIDLNTRYLEQAKNGASSNEKLLVADATQLPFKNDFFDRVIASEILEHIPDDVLALKEIFRVLKPGGIVMITVPNINYPWAWDPANWILERLTKKHLPSHIWWLSGIWADHQRLYAEKDIELKLLKTGFETKLKWRATHFCLPFSHFVFYGIGKNLVEKGWLKNFNRFTPNRKKSKLMSLLLWPIELIDRLNDTNKVFATSVNLVYQIRKPG